MDAISIAIAFLAVAVGILVYAYNKAINDRTHYR